jgi:hypothetical protein
VESVVADRHRALLGRRARELSTRTWADAVAELSSAIDAQFGAPVHL